MNLDYHCFGIVQVSEGSTSLVWISRQRKQRRALEDWIPPLPRTFLPPPKVSSCDRDMWHVLVHTLWPTLATEDSNVYMPQGRVSCCHYPTSPGLVWGRLGFVWGHSWLHHSLPSWLQPSQNLSLPLWPVLLNRSLSQRGQLPGPEILCLGSFIIPTPSNTLDARMSRP